MKTTTISLLTIFLFTGCAVSDAMLENYERNTISQNKNASMRNKEEKQFKNKFTKELIDIYGKEKGYYLAKQILKDDNNIKRRFNGTDYKLYIEDSVIATELNKANKIWKAEEKTIIIYK
jgi:hypothetical protein